MPDERALGLGLWLVHEQGRMRIEARDVGVFRDALTAPIVAGFGRLLAAADRLNALVYLIGLNRRDVEPVAGFPESAHRGESLARERGDVHLITLTWAAFTEATHTIGGLEDAGVRRFMCATEALEAWEELVRLRERWKGATEREIRNELAHHFGFEQTHRAGLDAWPSSEPLTVCEWEGDGDGTMSLATMRFHLGANLVLCGRRIQIEEIERIADQGEDDFMVFTRCAMRCFLAVLHAQGAHVPSPAEVLASEQSEDEAH